MNGININEIRYLAENQKLLENLDFDEKSRQKDFLKDYKKQLKQNNRALKLCKKIDKLKSKLAKIYNLEEVL